ncbi:MAG: hypothetical protein RLY86_539 [Pseudomonadota bacterium]|jgi:hypothetical protein
MPPLEQRSPSDDVLTDAARQAATLAASLDAAADELETVGPVSRGELAAALAAFDREWTGRTDAAD